MKLYRDGKIQAKRENRDSFMYKDGSFKKVGMFLVITTMFIICCSLWSCTRSTPPPPPEEILKIFPEDSQTVYDLRRGIDIYIDGSASMEGFINSQGNTTLGRVIAGLRSFHVPQYQLSFYKFGTGGPERLEPNRFWVMSSKRGLFDQPYTRLDLTIGSFFGREKASSAYLVITDGVQASPIGSDYPAFVDPINEWLGQSNHILHIYAFRGEFDGTIYPEAGGSSFHYRSDPNSQATFRPFYIYAFILDQSLEEKISDFIRGLKVSYKILNFSDKIFKKGKLEFDTRAKMGKGTNNCLRRYSKAKEEKGRTIQYLLWRSKGIGLEQGKLNVNFKLGLTDFGSVILQNPDMVKVGAEILQLNRKVWVKKNPKGKNIRYFTWVHHPVPNMNKYLPEVENSRLSRGTKAGSLPKLTTQLRFSEMPEPGWYAYHINLLPKNDSFQIPDWVKDWSTDRDDTHRNANKTLNFENVVSCILNNAPIKRRNFGEFFVAINFR